MLKYFSPTARGASPDFGVSNSENLVRKDDFSKRPKRFVGIHLYSGAPLSVHRGANPDFGVIKSDHSKQHSIFGLVKRQLLETAKTSCGDSPVLRKVCRATIWDRFGEIRGGGYSSVRKHAAL